VTTLHLNYIAFRIQTVLTVDNNHMDNLGTRKHFIYSISALLLLGFSQTAFAHGGRLNKEGCHNNRSTGDYHCHRGASEKFTEPKSSYNYKSRNEDYFNDLLAKRMSGRREVKLSYSLGTSSPSNYVIIDIETDLYVIEGGLDKRSSLDSIQQALFASAITGKEPAVAIYDTDQRWGKYEHRIWTAAKKIGLKFFWFNGQDITEK